MLIVPFHLSVQCWFRIMLVCTNTSHRNAHCTISFLKPQVLVCFSFKNLFLFQNIHHLSDHFFILKPELNLYSSGCFQIDRSILLINRIAVGLSICRQHTSEQFNIRGAYDPVTLGQAILRNRKGSLLGKFKIINIRSIRICMTFYNNLRYIITIFFI